MTTLNAATINSMTRASIWAYITDNSLPVAKKRSTEDARQVLATYMQSIATIESTEPTVSIESTEPTVSIESTEPTVSIESTEPASQIGASIVLVAIITGIWLVFTQLIIPAAIWILNLVTIGYRKAVTAYRRHTTQTEPIDYFPDLAEVG